MSELQTPRVLVPIGRAAGPEYRDDSTGPVYRVVIGDRYHSLGETEYRLWELAHGQRDFDAVWNRADTAQAATAEGIGDPDSVINDLCSATLLQEVCIASDDGWNFAANYRPVPLVLGMRALTAGTGPHAVAVRDRVLAETNSLVYEVFTWAAMFEDLRSNCERISRRVASGEFALEEQWSAPSMIADLFLTGCHELLAAQALCFDLAPGRWAARQPAAEGAA